MGPSTWLDEFDERQQKEIRFSRLYAQDFAHGTEGHNAKLIIAKMASLLDQADSRINGLVARLNDAEEQQPW